MTFVVFAMPRSRSVWLSHFLSYREWNCAHDTALQIRGLEDVKSWLDQPFTGTVETSATPFWRTLKTLKPDATVVIVRRPIEEIIDSFRRLGLPFDFDKLRQHLQHLERKLDQIERRMNVLSVTYDELKSEAACAKVFEACLPYKHDHAWWSAFQAQNIQRSVGAQMIYYNAHRVQCDRTVAQIKVDTLARFSRRPSIALDGLDIKTEPFDTLYRDAKGLFRQHLVAVGEDPEAYEAKNIPLWRSLDAAGLLECTTARSNGRVFGYLLTVIVPSLESAGLQVAVPTIFYASPDFPGLGRRLQLAAKDAAIARDLDEIQFRAGVRGDGPRLAALFERMGATDHGRLYRLKLKD